MTTVALRLGFVSASIFESFTCVRRLIPPRLSDTLQAERIPSPFYTQLYINAKSSSLVNYIHPPIAAEKYVCLHGKLV